MRSYAPDSLLDAVASALTRVPVRPGAVVLAAVSGGADSVALLHALLELRERFGISVAAAHLNHRLRGAESDRDEAFVRELCARSGVELRVERVDEDDLAPGSANLEERARELRHEFLARAADCVGAAHIALAHHAGDQAETVLMRILRGAGAAGLAAMAEAGPGRIIRPMLSVTRAEILAWLAGRALAHVDDSSNASMSLVRNRVRHHLLPMLEREYAPGLSRRLVELGAEMRALDDLADSLASRELHSMRTGPDSALGLARFPAIHPALQASILRMFIAERRGSLRGVTRAHVEALRRLCLDGPSNGEIDLPGRWRAARQYQFLSVERAIPRSEENFAMPLALEGTTIVAAAGFAFDAKILDATDAALPRDNDSALFDLGALQAGAADAPLTVRNFVRGDRIAPLGMEGSRKLKEIFIDRKVPRARRASYPVVTLRGEIVWLPGLARGRGALLTSATETVLRVAARGVGN